MINFSVNELENAEKNRIWLIHSHRPQQEVDRKWEESYILRVQDCSNKIYQNVNDIVIKWPVLKCDFGFLLVRIFIFGFILRCTGNVQDKRL